MAEIESGLPNQEEPQVEQMPDGQEALQPEAQEDGAAEEVKVEGGDEQAEARERAFKQAQKEIDADSELSEEGKAFLSQAFANLKEGKE